jgi:hypothetical protein
MPQVSTSMLVLDDLLRAVASAAFSAVDMNTFRKEFTGGGCDDPRDGSPLDFVSHYLSPSFQRDRVSLVIGEPAPLPDLSYMDTFPKRLYQVFMYKIRKDEDDDFVLLAQLQSGLYILYRATCCYTGFNVQGDMKIIASRSLARLIEFGLTDKERLLLHAAQLGKLL